MFSAFRTPAVLFVMICLLYVLSGLLLFIGLETISFACDCVIGLAMIAMLTWAFIRYSGQYREVGTAIDQAAGVMLEQVKYINICVTIKMKENESIKHVFIAVSRPRMR